MQHLEGGLDFHDVKPRKPGANLRAKSRKQTLGGFEGRDRGRAGQGRAEQQVERMTISVVRSSSSTHLQHRVCPNARGATSNVIQAHYERRRTRVRAEYLELERGRVAVVAVVAVGVFGRRQLGQSHRAVKAASTQAKQTNKPRTTQKRNKTLEHSNQAPCRTQVFFRERCTANVPGNLAAQEHALCTPQHRHPHSTPVCVVDHLQHRLFV